MGLVKQKVNRDPNNDVGWRLATMNEIEDDGPHATPERLLPVKKLTKKSKKSYA